MERPGWAPAGLDLERPSVARVYDYYLGGSHNFAVDREFAEKVLETMPNVPELARQNRAFLRRAVRHLCEAGIDQFFASWGSLTLAELLERLGISRELMVAEAMRHAPGVLEALREEGLLEGSVRRLLEPFYRSEAFAKATGG